MHTLHATSCCVLIHYEIGSTFLFSELVIWHRLHKNNPAQQFMDPEAGYSLRATKNHTYNMTRLLKPQDELIPYAIQPLQRVDICGSIDPVSREGHEYIHNQLH